MQTSEVDLVDATDRDPGYDVIHYGYGVCIIFIVTLPMRVPP